MIEIVLVIVVGVILLIVLAPSFKKMNTENIDRRIQAQQQAEDEIATRRAELENRERRRYGGSRF